MKVFVSYSRKDLAIVTPLVSSLVAAGVDVWIDEKKLAGGQSLWGEIATGIEDCDWFIPVLSEHSMHSDWFHREVHHAFVCKRKKTIPVLSSTSIELLEFPKWLTEILAPLISEPDKILKAIEFDRYDNLVSRGRKHMKEKRYEHAVDAFQAAINQAKKQPDDNARDSLLHLELAAGLYAMKKFDEARRETTHAINLRPSVETHLHRAKCAYELSDFEMAIEDFRACLSFDPENPNALNGLGVVLHEQQKSKSEIPNLFRKAIERCNRETGSGYNSKLKKKLYNHLGMVLEKESQANFEHREELLREASTCFLNAVKIDPNDSKIRFSLAYTEHRLGNLASAVEHYRQIDDVIFPRAQFCLGYALYEREEFSKAIPVFMRSEGLFASNNQPLARVESIVGLARCYLRLNRAVEAVREGERAKSLDSTDIRVLLVLAEALALKGDHVNASIYAQMVADQRCVRASELLAKLCGTNTRAGMKYSKEAKTMRGLEEPGFLRTIFGLRQTLTDPDAATFEPADVLSSDTGVSICHLKKWKCGDRCCM